MQDSTSHPLIRGMSDDLLAARPVYDGAPRPISPREAATIAADEYGYRRGDRDWMLLSRGSDGGMHYRGPAYSEGAARGWCNEKARGLTRRILAGEGRYMVFFDRARDRYYLG
jgi:hypothetical protein